MFSSMNEKKKTMISWIMYVISVVLLLVEIIISISPSNGSFDDLDAVAISMTIIGIINLVLIVIGLLLFVKNLNTEKGNTAKVVGVTLRVIVLVLTFLMTGIWIIGWIAGIVNF